MSTPRYTATLKGTTELALHGAADIGWWRDHLAPEGLEPLDVDGRAHVLITGLDGRWLAWSFRDISVSVMARPAGSAEESLFYARAFNSSRFLEFFERRWFKLPYTRAAGKVSLEAIRLADGDLLASRGPREAVETQELGYEGPLYIPGKRWLQVHVFGATSVWPFDASRDAFSVGKGVGDPVLLGLRESGFDPREWHVRASATHRRTKTFSR